MPTMAQRNGSKIEIPEERRCTANNHVCPCGYRFQETDARWQDGGKCPICGESRRCRNTANRGYPTCRMHGAGSPHKGRPGGRPGIYGDIFRPNMPPRMMPVYEAALEDERLLQLRQDIALLEARKHDILGRVDTGESGYLWQALKEAYTAYEKALGKSDVDGMKEYLAELGKLIKKGHADYTAWREAEDTIERKARLIDREYKYLETTHRMISTERLMQLVEGIAIIIKREVGDVKVIKSISGQLFELLERIPQNEPAMIEAKSGK